MKNLINTLLRGLVRVLPEWVLQVVYNGIFKPRFLRRILNFFLKLIVPSEVEVCGVRYFLNPRDPVLSTLMTLGIHEEYEVALFRQRCREGMTVLDIGANIGYYSGIAAMQVGAKGRILSFEPDPECFSYLVQMSQANGFDQISPFNYAIGREETEIFFYITDDNKADGRIYDPSSSRKKIKVPMKTIDGVLKQNGIKKVDVVKIDVQGAEGLVFAGMQDLLKENRDVCLFLELWPWGVRQTGLSCVSMLKNLVQDGFKIGLIDESKKQVISVGDVELFVQSVGYREYSGVSMKPSNVNLICYRS